MTMQKYNFVYMGLNDWRDWHRSGFFTRSGAIARELERHPLTNQLIILGNASSFVTALARLAAAGPRPPGKPLKTTAWFSTYRVAERALLVVPRKLLPREESLAPFYLINRLIHDRFVKRLLKNIIEAVGKGFPTVLWIANPLKTYWIGNLGEDISVFDSIEDLRHHPGNRLIAGHIDSGYRLARERAAAVFAVSKPMVELLSNESRSAILTSNGLNRAIFHEAAEPISDLSVIRKPIAGYVGTLQERVDVGLLEKLALEQPEISQVLVGPVTAPGRFARLRRYPNVHFIGRKPHHLVPGYIKSFDICLLPHHVDPLTASMNPLKLYEYIAAGKRVVSSCPVDMVSLCEAVTIARDPDNFVAEVVRQSAITPDQTIGRLSAYVKDTFDWPSVVDRMLSAALPRGGGGVH